jgi:hypothetical protein
MKRLCVYDYREEPFFVMTTVNQKISAGLGVFGLQYLLAAVSSVNTAVKDLLGGIK